MNKITRSLGFSFLMGLYVAPHLGMSEGPKGGGENLAARKEHILKELDEKIAKFQAAKSCIQSASTMEALKECRPKGGRGGEGGGGPGGPGGPGGGPDGD